MKVVVAGIRYSNPIEKIIYDDYAYVAKAIIDSGFKITTGISGRAVGVDRLGETWADANDVSIESKPADWKKYGRGGGVIRNKEMAEMADAAVIVWDGKSTGTYNMIQNMIKLKKTYHLVLTEGTTNTLEGFM